MAPTNFTPPQYEVDTFNYQAQEEWFFETGDTQSPINIRSNAIEEMWGSSHLFLKYDPIATQVFDSGSTIRVVSSGKARINGRPFQLIQYHFHAPSEHTVDGKYYPLELHFVHRSQNQKIAVVGVFFEIGSHNKAFEQIMRSLEEGTTDQGHPATIEVAQLLPEDKSYYHYMGSLTTPPLTENVEWYLLQHTIQLDEDQLAEFHRYYTNNHRQIQPCNERMVLHHEEKNNK
jgi:carbonic anhydrase